MKYLVFILAIAVGLSAQAGHDGNGGGGIKKDGRYMTFYSAGLYTEKKPSGLTEIPGLEMLIDLFYEEIELSAKDRIKQLEAIEPSDSRRYYKVKPETFSEEVRSRLREVYSGVVGTPKESIALFALTDTSSRITYLLPSFYELTKVEQTAILFHEGYWINNPKAKYNEVVDAEIKMQDYLETKTDNSLVELLEVIASDKSILQYAIKKDLEKKSFGKFLNKNGSVKLEYLIGTKFIRCRMDSSPTQCIDHLKIKARFMAKNYPKSMSIPLLYDYIIQGKLILYISMTFRDGVFVGEENAGHRDIVYSSLGNFRSSSLGAAPDYCVHKCTNGYSESVERNLEKALLPIAGISDQERCFRESKGSKVLICFN